MSIYHKYAFKHFVNNPIKYSFAIILFATSFTWPLTSHANNTSALLQADQTDDLTAVDQQIDADVKNGFPGAVLLVYKDGKILKRTSYGYKLRYDTEGHELAQPKAMSVDTLFDLASNTKMYATNFAIMHLVYEKKLDINKPVHYYLPEYTGCDQESPAQCRDDRLVKDLLTHSSGYMPSAPFYNPDGVQVYGPNLYSQDRDETINILNTRLPFVGNRGGQPVYTDPDFMLLGIMVERITGQRLDQYVSNTIYKPLGLTHTSFNPEKNDLCAATELKGNTRDGTVSFPNIREQTIQCEVHDENAYYSMGGIAGHAGLFSTADDMAILLQVLLNNGHYGDVVLWDKAVEDAFTEPNAYDDSYGVGWRRSGSQHYYPFGDYAPADTIGHTGFTGTLTVIDRSHHLFYILLTNKIHTPIVNGQFTGNNYATGHYEQISNLIYQALVPQG